MKNLFIILQSKRLLDGARTNGHLIKTKEKRNYFIQGGRAIKCYTSDTVKLFNINVAS